MMGRIGVQSDPAVSGCVVTGNCVPQAWHRPTHRLNRSDVPETGQLSIDRNRIGASASRGQQLADGESCCANSRRREILDCKNGGQHTAAAKLDTR